MGDYFQLMNVSLSAPYDRRVGRHVLFRNNQVQVCLTAKANKLTEEVRFLQNAAFGYVLFPLIPLDSPFCDIDKNTCTNMRIGPKNDQKCMADAALLPGLDVDITWIVMSTQKEPGKDCETSRDIKQLASRGKKKLMCIKIPAVIRNKPRKS